MSSVGSVTTHSVPELINDEQQEEDDIVRSENRHPSADGNARYEHLSDEELLRRVLQVEEEEEEDRDRDLVEILSLFQDPDELSSEEAEQRRVLEPDEVDSEETEQLRLFEAAE